MNELIVATIPECSTTGDEDDEYVPKISEAKLDEAYASVLLDSDSNDLFSFQKGRIYIFPSLKKCDIFI